MHEMEFNTILTSSRLPLKPEEALKLYEDKLSLYERIEILDYVEIWHLGIKAQKIMANPDHENSNYGYDDSHHSYRKIKGDHIAYRYEIRGLLGTGSFGEVLRAYDHRNKEVVALKILKNEQRFLTEAMKEINILKTLNDKDIHDRHCIVRMKDFFCFRHHYCITFELLGQDLYQILDQNNFRGFTMSEIKRVAVSVLQCLHFIHREKIIHCDVKPENILMPLREPGSIKVIDFSCSCYQNERIFDYIQTRYYRAPEIILGIPYSTQIDMWSLGCVLAEIHTGLPLFPGDDEKDQLACIMEVCSRPPDMILTKARKRSLYFDTRGNPRPLKNKKCIVGAKKLYQVVKTRNHDFLNFIQQCLHWDANMRMTAWQGLNHEWIKEKSNNCFPCRLLKRQ